jgi:chlorobactene glucosyltransferase
VTWALGIALLPWIAALLVVAFGVREPPALPAASRGTAPGGHRWPSVRIIVPARNEARSIARCVGSLAAQDYPDFRIVVVDDRSTDETSRLAREVARRNARAIEVRAGAPLPPGWFGKPWACAQGSAGADEDLLLFTDADTVHDPSALLRSVSALTPNLAALTLLGSQELGSVGERLVQPQMFTILALRFRGMERPLGKDDRQNAIANGQYILVRRAAYEAIGGHGAVRGEVAEDLRLAQELTGEGHLLALRRADDALSTRMYRSLGEVLNGWTKNVAIGASQSAGRWGGIALLGMVVYALGLWVAPAVVLLSAAIAGLAGAPVSPELLAWSVGATLAGVIAWSMAYRRFDVSPAYALLFPVGAALVAAIALRSGWRGGRRVEWKGRRYSVHELTGESR